MEQKMNKIQIKPKFNNLVEQRILGFLIGIGKPDYDKVQIVFARIDEHVFHDRSNKELFLLLKQLYLDKAPFDSFSIINQIPNSLFSLYTDLTSEQYFSINCVDDDLNTLLHLETERQKATIYTHTLNAYNDALFNEDCATILDDGIAKLNAIENKQEAHDVLSFEDIYKQLEVDGFANELIQTSLKTWPPFPASSMITVVGRSGIGKSYFSLYLMQKIMEACPGKQGIYINLEMKPVEIMKRYANLLSPNGGNPNQLHLLKEQLAKTPISLVSTPLMTIEEIEDKVRVLSAKMPLSVVLVDYIGLVRIKDKTDKKYQDQEEIAQRLAALAINYQCIVLCLLQVNREHKNRPVGSKCPDTTDAADSTGCEKSSHWWLGIDQPQKDSDDPVWRNKFIIKNRKSRGEEGYFTIVMDFKDGRFIELDQRSLHLPSHTSQTKSKWDLYNQTVNI
jgi:replicative DNA helicase